MLHVMTITHIGSSKFTCGRVVKTTERHLLTWEGVKRMLEHEREFTKGRNYIYYITLSIYRGQPLT